jgi:predicted amidohydrolase YtcJ
MPAADLVLKNARVMTMVADRPAVAMVAVEGDSISYVGSDQELDSFVGPGTRVIDCAGRAVLPGFNDAHLHLFSLVGKLLSIDLGPGSVQSIEDIKEKIREKARNTPRGTWLSGAGFNEFYLVEKRYPTRRDLDEAVPDHPVFLSHRSMHACVLNSLGLEMAGIGRETAEPPGGRIERDVATGEPNGILIGMLDYIRRGVMPPLSEAELDRAISTLDRSFLSLGITSVQDATVTNDLARWERVCRLVLNRQLRSRVTFLAGAPYWKDFQKMGLKTGSGDNLMRLGAVKFIPGAPKDQAELNDTALGIQQAGFQLAFHAIEEGEVTAAVSALEYVDSQSGVKGRRHRIEHCSECPDYLLDRIKKLGAVIVTQPPFIYYSGERYLVTVPESRQPWLYRLKSPLELGIVVAGSSDAPVAYENPMIGVYAAVTRRAASGQLLLREERIGIEQALALYTVNAAYASFEEKIKGSLAPGKLADMVILSSNPAQLPPEDLKDVKVDMTIIGGELVWES